MKSYLLIILLLITTGLHAQKVLSDLSIHFDALSNGQSSFLSKEQIVELSQQEGVIEIIENACNSGKDKTEREAIRLAARIGANHSNDLTRQAAVSLLLNKVKNVSPKTVDKIVKGLQKFQVDDFDTKSQEQLITIIKTNPPHLQEWIKIAGWLQMKELLETLLPTYQEEENLRTAFYLALARSGNKEKLEQVMEQVKELKINDDFNYQVMPLLIYVRQPVAMDFLFDVVESDEKNCRPAAADTKGSILCAYRVLEAIAPYIKNFPVQVGPSGDLEVKDYKKALQTVREWIKEHQNDYELWVEKY